MEIHRHNGKLITKLSKKELIEALIKSKIEIQRLKRKKAPLEYLIDKITESIK